MAEKNIGYVVELTGNAQVKTVEGIIKVLSIGDKIHEGDILTTGIGTEILIEFYNGQQLQVSENAEVLLDESVYADLQPLGDDRADQLAQLQQLIVEGVDLADLEAAAAGNSPTATDALHAASIYIRDGAEGSVDTQATPFSFDGSGPDNEETTGDDDVFAVADGAASSTSTDNSPVAGIAINPITSDNIINAQESGQPISVTGFVTGDAIAGDTINLIVNGTTYTGSVASDNTFSITVAGSDLAAQTSIEATVSGTDSSGSTYFATTTSTHDVDTTTSASISVDSITSDDIVNLSESTSTIDVTGTVNGDAGPGDIVSFVINGNAYLGTVEADNTFSISVAGADLAAQNTFDATVTGSDSAGNSFSASTTSSHTVNVSNNNPDAMDDADITNEDIGINIDVLSNDSDLDGDTVSVTSITQGSNGSVSINADGTVNYTPDLDFEGNDSFTYTISDGRGGFDTATVNLIVNGTNDIATVSADSQSVVEDAAALLTTGGSIIVTDVDTGEAFAQPQTNTAGTYGTFNIDASGNWTYEADNTQTAIQELSATDTLTDTFTVFSQDGSASNTVTVTINGTNDTATVSADAQSITEDDAALLTTGGSITVTDVDAGEAFAQPQTNTAGTYGTFNIDANGNWTYEADNTQTAIQELGATDTLTDTFTVFSQDGSASNTVTVTINGTNDTATVSADSQSVTEDDAALLTTGGTVTVTDTDAGEAFAQPQTNTAGTYGTFNIDANGNWTYEADNTQTAIQELGATDTLTDTFTVFSQDGSASNTVTVTINGTNDIATVSADSQSVTEDDAALLTTGGTVTVTDTDAGEAFAQPQTNTAGTYGTFNIDANGNWTYEADNTQTAIQELGATDTLTDTFTVFSQDGSASNTVTVTINGTNDVATVSADSQSVTEDDAALLTTGGTVTVTDTDSGEAFAQPQTNTAGTYGTFNIDANGNWTYEADNTQTAIQELGATDTLTDTFTVFSQDGSASNTVTVTINGTNDTATVSADAQSVTEDDAALLTTGGIITVTDVDAGEAFAQPQTNVAGTYGTFNIDANGNWTYEADNTQTAIQELGATDTLTDTFTVFSQDGSASNTVTVTINGTNDTATVSADAQSVTEDDAALLTTGGSITVTDTDSGEAFAQPQTNTAGTYGTFNIDASGNWTYEADNTQTAIQELGATDTLTDTFTVFSQDGSASNTVTVTINGTNDIATVSADAQSVTEDDAALLTTGGSIIVTDVDAGEAFAQPQTNTAGTYGTFNIDANGNWTYEADNTQTAIQELGATDTLTDTFTVFSQDGSASNTVTVTINGTNDTATVSADAQSVIEDDAALLTTGGSITVTDVDVGEAFAQPQTNTAGTYGTFNIDANGNWTYEADNTQTAIQELGATDTLTDTFTVFSQDGSASNTVTVTINGTNDIATVSADAQSVTEDDAALLTTGGSITVTDVDAGEAFAQPQTNTAGTYGTFNIDASGNWTYEADNTQTAIQELGATDTLTDTFTVFSQDGSASNTVTVTINGTNDIATVSADAQSVTEDDAALLTTGGSITVTDVDAGEAFAQPQTNTAGTYGTFNIDANGNWTYEADNTQTAIQELGATDTLTDTFTVFSQDGSASNTVTVTINGTNDTATVSADSQSVTEDDAALLTTGGTITVTDVDAGEAFAQPQTNTAGTYGTFNIDANGNWTYEADNTQTAIQELGATDTLTDTFTVFSQDGSASNTVTVTINGTNDTATVSADSQSVTEDDAALLTTGGTITVTDVDAGEAFAQPQTNTAGTYGTFNIDASGNWTYEADNTQTAIQELGATDTLTDTFTVFSQDGSASNTVTVTINGTNDTATVSADAQSITEDDAALLTTGGSITVTDVDAGEAFAQPQTNTAGTYGTFNIDANGNWTYEADNTQTAIQELGATDTLTDTFTVFSQDGSASNTVTVTINGTNDTAAVSADAQSVTEDDAALIDDRRNRYGNRCRCRRSVCTATDQYSRYLRHVQYRCQR